ncbi:MAG: menaquinone biosynthesis protein [Nitrospirae bacterium]|nr:menaquinone biosynthesis protein [Nitrospirota bacterium]
MLRIGRIDFANLYPIFHCLARRCARTVGRRYEFVGGVPSQVNALMRQGVIDVGPASSIEYLRNRHLYDLIQGHCIAARGSVMSIILFSTVEIERLNGATILTTAQAETSTALLNIIMRKFYGLDCRFLVSDAPLTEGLSRYPAYLLIGDNALLESQHSLTLQAPPLARPEPAPGSLLLQDTPGCGQLYAYDLSTIWYEHTGESFVFALWFAQKGCDAALIESLRGDLDLAREEALSNLHEIAVNSPYASTIPVDVLCQYWITIGYKLTDSQMRGLRLFERYSRQLGLL